MNVQWHEAAGDRREWVADVNGHRLFVQQTLRSRIAHPLIGTEFQACVDGVRLDEFASLIEAQGAAARVTETNTAPQGEPRGRLGSWGFDYREFAPALDY